MDFFQRAKNFFTGAGWTSDDEERKKKQQQSVQKAVQQKKAQQVVDNRTKPQNQAISNLFGNKPKPNNTFNLQPKPKPLAVQPVKPPVVKAAPQITPPKIDPAQVKLPQKVAINKPNYSDQEAQTLSALYKQGRVNKDMYVKYTQERAKRANAAMTNGKVSAGDVVGAVANTLGADDFRKAAGQQKVSEAIRKQGYDPSISIGKDKDKVLREQAIKKAELETGVKYDINEGMASGLGILSNFLGTGGVVKGLKTSGKVAAGTADEVKDVIKSKMVELIEKAKKNKPEIPTTRVERMNQRNADDALKAAEERTAKAAEGFSKKKDDIVTIKEPNTNLPLPETTALAHRQALQGVVNRELASAEEYVNKHPELTQPQREQLVEKTRERIDSLTRELQDQRVKTLGVVDEAGAKADEAVKAQQGTVEEVKAAQKEAVAPVNPGGSPAPAEEFRLNNPYDEYQKRVTDEAGLNREDGLVKSTLLHKLLRPASKLQQKWVETVDKGRESLSDTIQQGVQSGNAVTAAAANAPKMLFKNVGLSDANRDILLKRTSRLQNAGSTAKYALRDMDKAVEKAGDPSTVYERIYRVLETPEYLAKRYGDGTKLSVGDLTPEERQAFEKLVSYNKIRNDLNLDTGLINAEQHTQFADGLHSPRVYDLEALGNPAYDVTRYLNLNAGKKRKDIGEIDENIIKQSMESPFQASALRLEQAFKNKANQEGLRELESAGLLFDKKPNKNFMQLTGKKYGDMEGKWVDSQILSQFDNKEYYTSNIGQAISNTVDAYQGSPLGVVDRFMKSTKTVLSPGTFGGNVGANVVAFGGAANVNPATTAGRMVQAAKQLAEHSNGKFNPNVNRAELAGLFSGDTGRAITGSREAGTALKGSKNPYNKAQDIYGGVDKSFALGLFNELIARGLSEEQAVKRTHLAMQNYGNVGRVIHTSADSPILGKPFARFIPELMRIMKNRALYNPVGSAAGLGGVAYGANELSKASGETNEERAARENAVGQTQIPLTGEINKLMTGGKYDGNIALNLAMPDNIGGVDLPGTGSAVNIARTVGLNSPIEPGGDASTAIIRQLNPFADMTRTNAQGDEVFAPAQSVSSMFFKPIADQIANRDFMGREITDPDNKTYYEADGHKVQKYSDKLSDSDQLQNRAETLGMNWLPFANEANAVFSSLTGQKDYYGKERSVPQAIARALGVKVEDNSQDKQAERVESKKYFEEDLPAVQGFLKANPDLADNYFKLRNPSRNRITNISDNDLITPEKWDIINSDTSGRMLGFLKEQAIKMGKEKGTGYDPIYDLPDDQLKYVSELRSRPSGDDIEAQEILRATTDWFPAYEDKYYAYLDGIDFENQKKYPGSADKNPRVLEYQQYSKPVEQPELIKKYYQIKNENPDAAKEFYKANKDSLGAAFDDYAAQRLGRINNMRRIEGYDPISSETFANKSFGFDTKASGSGYGSGYGYGGGGSGGRGRQPAEVNTLGELTNFAGDPKRINEIQPEQIPELATLLQQLMAGAGGGRGKPPLGASSRGQG